MRLAYRITEFVVLGLLATFFLCTIVGCAFVRDNTPNGGTYDAFAVGCPAKGLTGATHPKGDG